MTTERLLKLLCCPETHQALSEAAPALIVRLNQLGREGKLSNRGGQAVHQPLDGGFVREDGKILYPIYQKIPVMLIDEGIPL